MTAKKMEIAKVVVQMGKKEIPLTLEEAENLHKLLDKMFGEKVVEKWYPYSRPHWYWGNERVYCSGTTGDNSGDQIGNMTYCSSNATATLSIS